MRAHSLLGRAGFWDLVHGADGGGCLLLLTGMPHLFHPLLLLLLRFHLLFHSPFRRSLTACHLSSLRLALGGCLGSLRRLCVCRDILEKSVP